MLWDKLIGNCTDVFRHAEASCLDCGYYEQENFQVSLLCHA